MKTMLVAFGMLVLLGGELASASADRSTQTTAKSATSAPVSTDAPIRLAGRMVTGA